MHNHHHHHEDAHDHGHHHHHAAQGTTLIVALGLTLGFAVVEAISGWISNSLALLGDAGHMASDAFALGLAALAAWLARKPPSPRHSYGMVRAEIVVATINGVFMLIIVFSIVSAAIERMSSPQQVDAGTVILVALIGLCVNILVAWVLMRGEQSLNIRGALLHVMGDLLGSVAALVSGIVIYFSGWMLIDPLLSVLICVLILVSTLRLLREVLHVIMEGVPLHLDLEKVGKTMASVQGVKSVHDLHIWTLASGSVALSAHVVLDSMDNWQAILRDMQHVLEHEYHIDHVTLQPTLAGADVFVPISEIRKS